MDGWNSCESIRENMRAEQATQNVKNTKNKTKFTMMMKKTNTHS